MRIKKDESKAPAEPNKSPDRYIKKVKITKDDKIEIHYERYINENWDQFSLICAQAARPDFYQALKALVVDVVEILDLPEMYGFGITVQGVTFSYGGEAGVMGAVIVARKALVNSNAPFCFNTPHKSAAPYTTDGDDSKCLTSDCVKRLEVLMQEAWDYVEGHRAQLDLFDETEQESESEKKDLTDLSGNMN